MHILLLKTNCFGTSSTNGAFKPLEQNLFETFSGVCYFHSKCARFINNKLQKCATQKGVIDRSRFSIWFFGESKSTSKFRILSKSPTVCLRVHSWSTPVPNLYKWPTSCSKLTVLGRHQLTVPLNHSSKTFLRHFQVFVIFTLNVPVS